MTKATDSETDLLRDLSEAMPGPKRPSSTVNEDPTISFKKQGRIVLNRPSASAFQVKHHEYVLMLMNRKSRRLFLKSTTKDDPHGHRIAYGRGGIPGLIVGKAALEGMGFDLSESRPPIEVRPHEINRDQMVGPYQFKPGDIVLAADIPPEFLRGEASTGKRRFAKRAGRTA